MTTDQGSREIISASRRTDIPAFHTEWMLRRLRAGFCHVIHPYSARVRRVSLAPEDVHGIVFWTRWPRALLPHVVPLTDSGYSLTFQFTINGADRDLETHSPPVERAIECAAELARRLGPEAVRWRYDPIVLGPDRTAESHRRRFARLARGLEGVTRSCTFSFVDFYGKTERNLARSNVGPVDRPDQESKRALAADLAALAADRGMMLLSCCDDGLLGPGIGRSSCVSGPRPDPAGTEGVAVLPPAPTRQDCGCVRSVDIGAYDTCAFGCVYCYAVSSRAAALRRLAAADPTDTVLRRPAAWAGVDLARRASEPRPSEGKSRISENRDSAGLAPPAIRN
ncbi:MAG: DUF1848 domain-containing protein [bacterium]